MAGTKISTTIDTSITLGTAGYPGPISITKTGAIEPVQYGATALTIPSHAAHAQVVNHGLILGGSGYNTGPNYMYGIAGGDGLKAGAGAKIVNDGTIIGGGSSGRNTFDFPPYVPNGAGAGVDIYGAHAVLINNDLIEGGAGIDNGVAGVGISVASGAVVLNNGTVVGGVAMSDGGSGGAAIDVQRAVLSNSGTIEGGSAPGYGFTGAAGVVLAGGKVLNDGLIIGGEGGGRAQGAYGYRFGQGGAGVSIAAANATLLNDAKIYGGVGGYGAGAGGDGVTTGKYASISVINNGLVAGGVGGGGTFNSGYSVYTGNGGTGVTLYDNSRLNNYGTILGGAGSHYVKATAGDKPGAGGGGLGVGVFGGGTVMNAGTIAGATGVKGGGGGGTGLIASGPDDASVSNTGIILGGGGGAAAYGHVNGGGGGGGIVFDSNYGIGINSGTIIGGNGGAAGASHQMGSGGDGADIDGGAFTNTGIILGGAGVVHRFGYLGITKIGGGYGAAIANGGTLINKGNIAAGASGGTDYGAAGVFIYSGNLVNSGEILAGISGTATARYAENEGVSGGTGVFIDNTSYESVTNSGTILGGAGANAGSSAASFGASGGYGVVLQGGGNLAVNRATFDNSGTITGGVAGLGNSTNIFGGEGGVGLRLSYGLVVNTGAISGGYSRGDLGGWGAFIGGYGTFINSGIVSGGSGRNGNNGMFVVGPSPASNPTIINTGTIMGGNASSQGASVRAGSGGWGVALNQGSLLNSGEIIGGTGGGAQRYDRFAAGWGVYVGGGTLTNAAGGVIRGGYDRGSGLGAFGVYLKIHSSVTNAGLIVGGATEYQSSPHGGPGSYAGQGGTGVYLALDATMQNSGTIVGGGAGVSGHNATGVAGGAGAFLTTYYYGRYHSYNTRLVNSGEITGGAGGSGSKFGGAGGAGVYLKGGTLITSGTITGGAGGYGKLGNGQNGDAVELTNEATLVVEQGAVFNGLVAGSGGTGIYADLLQLSGQSSKALTGIGTQITGFSDIGFASHAAWTIAGDTAGLAAGQAITGFTSSDAIELTNAAASGGQVSVGTAGIVTISAGGDIYHLDIAGAKVGESNFVFANYTLRESGMAAPAMTFLRPAPSTAVAPAPFQIATDPSMALPSWHAMSLSGTRVNVWSSQPKISSASYPGAFQDTARFQQTNLHATVTLHAG